MAINVVSSVRFLGRLLPDIILLTLLSGVLYRKVSPLL